MELNTKKCAVSAVLHAQAIAGLTKSQDEDAVIRLHLEGHIHLGRRMVPYLPPDKSYKYLGVLLTLTLNWSHQLKATMTTAVEQACKLQCSFATPAEKLQIYRSKIVAAMRYIFSTTAFSPLDIKRLDAGMTHFTKGAVGPMGCTPNALVHEDISKGGWKWHPCYTLRYKSRQSRQTPL